MIGKAKWFQRRKYGGWGVFPKTWQGWAYIGVFMILLTLIQILPLGTDQQKLIATLVLVLLVIADTIHIMISMPRDERDRLHEATAERNALWVMIAVLATGVGYQAVSSSLAGNTAPTVDPVILIALVGGLIAKALTNLYLERHN
jgi:hypothetical protein